MLPSDGLEAFLAVVRNQGFSKAGKVLHITQSAVSQRLAQLEGVLETSLLIRHRLGVKLTPAGEALLQYCISLEAMETGLLARISNKTLNPQAITGVVRIAGFSSLMRSIVQKAGSILLRSHENLGLELSNLEIRELPHLLLSGATDFIILDHKYERQGIETELLGYEEYLMIEAASGEVLSNYLDHDTHDSVTHSFLSLQTKVLPKLPRLYLDDIYGIIEGVKQGLGRAVVPRHLVEQENNIKVIDGFKSFYSPVYLTFLSLSYDSALRLEIQQALQKACSDVLAHSPHS